ncbi:hypothetical protein GALMADRAFT_231368 [Galerina marginata CBS 339.88]|uniref:CxC5 like cysteine cluster associated with KDZ domain-containing protein n=1 Tax=Galerina marginata (strain CBS 339.88) TaxID=685588 RepID=A0A067SBZ5_GALM3|nr:hypothetical protein GALMADRAFT_231368 [Galerina marginata CBS 339.88]
MDILSLSQIFTENPELCSVFDYKAIQTYVELVNLLRSKIQALQNSYQPDPPSSLSVNIHEFLKKCFAMSDYMGKLAWLCFRSTAWATPFLNNDEEQAARLKHLKLFLDHGLARNIGVYNLQPPTSVCIDPRCCNQLHSQPNLLRERELSEPVSHPITVFSLDLGAVPGYSTSMYCRKCNTRYYPNYYVHSAATTRTYYTEMPTFIQSSQHFYMAVDLCELFTTMMVTSWTSATNCSRIYNQGLQTRDTKAALPADWPTSLELDVEDVWNGFFLHGLIIDRHELGSVLELEHKAESQAKRLLPALQERNNRMAGPGQEAWNHACDRCSYTYENEDGVYCIRSTVTDGITIGRPCCAVHDCPNSLPTVKHRYCLNHSDLAAICAVVSCKEKAESGFRTCSDPAHRKLEVYHHQQGKAMFQLKRRLERLKVSQTHDSLLTTPTSSRSRLVNEEVEATERDVRPENLLPMQTDSANDANAATASILEGSGADEDEDIVLDANGDELLPDLVDDADTCDGKPEAGNRTIKARFGRRRTHNEQLCVGSCGVILGRATFFGSEAPNGVRTFWMRLFPTQQSLPFVLWHDNNCRVVAMLKNDDDPYLRTYFDNCALPVDVFHFKSKHKESDEACGANCNPYIWPELRTPEGGWRFNSSAAEQTNAWFGGFQAMVREMQADRYDFFLDEMIKRRNRIVIKELKEKRQSPYLIPREELLGTHD